MKVLDGIATSLISGAMILPVGALDYIWGGWWLVVTTGAVGFLIAVAICVLIAWQEAKA